MEFVKWIILALVPFLLGVSVVNYLTVHPLRMSLHLLASCFLFSIVAVVLAIGFSRQQLIIAVPLTALASLVGYYVMTRRFLAREDQRPIPELTRKKEDQGKGHTAIIYFTHGEPELYDPIGWINQFKEFDGQNIPFVPLLARPFFAYQLRKKYLQVGRSDHRQMHLQMLKSLEREFRAEGDTTTSFYLSFLDDDPRPDAAVIQALNDGASGIIVSEVFLTISNHTAEGKELIEALNVEQYGVPIKYTGPMYDSRTLQSMFVQRANAHIGDTDKTRVGVLLVGHGQPDEWDEEWPTETGQEIGFRNDVLRLFEQDGYPNKNLSLAWMEFKDPKPAEKVMEFSRNGVEKVLYFSAAISADALHSQYDVPALIGEAQVSNDVALLNLGAWNDDPIVIKAIKEKIDLQM